MATPSSARGPTLPTLWPDVFQDRGAAIVDGGDVPACVVGVPAVDVTVAGAVLRADVAQRDARRQLRASTHESSCSHTGPGRPHRAA